jgi:surfeit locus 1 family protein
MKKPSLFWPLAFTIPAVSILLIMGFWQLERLAWKESLIDQRAAALAAEPVLLQDVEAEPTNAGFRRVFVTGRFLHDQEIFLQNRNRNGKRGLEVITPLRRVAEEGGGVVLVNRGWLPLEKQELSRRGGKLPTDTVKISGIARKGVIGRNAFTPANNPEKSLWYAYDPVEMARSKGFQVPPLIIEINIANTPGSFPMSGLNHYELKNNHLSYALTWFSLAAGLLLIFGLFARQRLRDNA